MTNMSDGGEKKSFQDQATEWLAAARANRFFAPTLIGAAVVAAVDQASKHWIVHGVKLQEKWVPCAKAPAQMCRQIPVSPIFDLTFVQNYGASFGLGAGGMPSRIILSLLSLTIATGLIIWLARIDRKIAATGIAFIIGGAIGNVYDRIAYGYVVDFLDFTGLWFPWVFNVADVSINVGVACLFVDAFLTRDA